MYGHTLAAHVLTAQNPRLAYLALASKNRSTGQSGQRDKNPPNRRGGVQTAEESLSSSGCTVDFVRPGVTGNGAPETHAIIPDLSTNCFALPSGYGLLGVPAYAQKA